MATRHSFQSELKHLQQVFEAMQPQMEVCLRDARLGVEGFVVVFNTGVSTQGPLPNCAKGGTRIRSGLNFEEVKLLARTMAIKNAAAGLPLGGCKSGLNADPRQDGFKNTYCRFIELCKPLLHENGGSFGGFGFDIGAQPEHALWACETLGNTRSFTGKPLHMGGTDYDREGIAGLGVAEAAKQLIDTLHLDIKQQTFVVHGLGALGAAVIKNLARYGAKLAGFGDPLYGGSWCFDGELSGALVQALSDRNIVQAMPLLQREGKKISDDANTALLVNTDVLFPCALQHAINLDNVEQLNCHIVVEGANNPITREAYKKLHQREICVVPDFIANAGGIISAFVEMTSTVSNEQNMQHRTKVKEAINTTRLTISDNVERMVKLSREHQCSLRDAALYYALNAIMSKELAI